MHTMHRHINAHINHIGVVSHFPWSQHCPYGIIYQRSNAKQRHISKRGIQHYCTLLGSFNNFNLIAIILNRTIMITLRVLTNSFEDLDCWELPSRHFAGVRGHHCVTHKMAPEPEYVDSKNVSWLNSKGSWLAYILLVLGLHFFLMTVPLISVPTVWTLTNVLHSLVSTACKSMNCTIWSIP